MTPYLGEYRYAVDGHGRVNVPARFRETLKQETAPELVLIKGLDRCIYLLPLSTWARFRTPFDDSELHADRQARWFLRDLLRGGGVQQPDSQGRIQLNKDLRAHSEIEDQAVIYGNDNRIEVWAPHVFDRYMDAGRSMGVSLEEGAALYLHGRGARRHGGEGNSDGGES